jgi:hypothetical protein
MIECEETYATAIRRPLKTNLFSCFVWWGFIAQRISAVKLSIQSNPLSTNAALKLCRVRALSEPTAEVLGFLETFKEKLEKIKGAVPSTSMLEPGSGSESAQCQNNSNPFHQEACSHFVLHQILTCPSEPEKTIHANLEKSLREFFEAFKNAEESSCSLSTAMKNAVYSFNNSGTLSTKPQTQSRSSSPPNPSTANRRTEFCPS